MAQKVSGVVFKVYPKEFPAKNGKKATTWYSIKLDGDDVYYRCQANKPDVDAGDYIELEHEGVSEDGKSAPVVKGSVKKIEQPKTPSGGFAPAGRDINIHYQSARKDALEFVSLLVKAGAVKLPVKESGKLEALEALVDGYTAQYFADTATQGAVARANGTDGTDTTKDVGEEGEE